MRMYEKVIGIILVAVVGIAALMYVSSVKPPSDVVSTSTTAIYTNGTNNTTTTTIPPIFSCYEIPAQANRTLVLEYVGRVLNSSDCCALSGLSGWSGGSVSNILNTSTSVLTKYNITINQSISSKITTIEDTNKCSGSYS